MASYFNLTLDTTAPSGLQITLDGGADYCTSTSVLLELSVSDGSTIGYQMKIWGTAAAANEADATWETYAASKTIVLPTGDGLKTVYVKVRDDVGNETSAASDTITLDTAVPAVTVTGPDKSKISKVSGFNASAFSFVSDKIFVEYKVKVVPATSSLHTAGTQIPTAGGSTNMDGTGSFPAATATNCTVYGADLESASSGDGTKIVKVFVKTAAGTWSNA